MALAIDSSLNCINLDKKGMPLMIGTTSMYILSPHFRHSNQYNRKHFHLIFGLSGSAMAQATKMRLTLAILVLYISQGSQYYLYNSMYEKPI
jgi:hypothetical protein